MIKIYADAAFYEKEYLLGRNPVISTGFEFYARQSSKVIDRYTFNRIQTFEEIPESVQMCCCELAEAEYRKENIQKESGGKTSERIGTYSVSFGTVQETINATERERRDIILKWLGDTGLCYQGVI